MADHGLAGTFRAFAAWFAEKISATRSGLEELYNRAFGLSVKFFVIKESNKVLYAELDSSFADVLIAFLIFPLGAIVRHLVEHHGNKGAIFGSLNSLYEGLSKLDRSHFRFGCAHLTMMDPSNEQQIRKFERGVENIFTGQIPSFIVTDDLQILANSPESYLQILKINGIDDDTDSLEERALTLGGKQIISLFERSLFSKTPLTDVLSVGSTTGTATLDETEMVKQDSLLPQTYKLEPMDSCPMNVKVLVQKSTSRILLAQSREDFVDFLYSFLSIPLGTAELLLDGNACLGSVDNLHRSIMKLYVGPGTMILDTNNTSLKPQLPPKNITKKPFFPLNQPGSLRFCPANLMDNKGLYCLIKRPTLFAVTDDLVVSTPPASTSSIIDRMKIPPSDVEELNINIGVEEALSILKASLTSTSALTDGLKPFLRTEPKQEEWCTF